MPVSNEGKEIKITDKRMFTPDGNLRDEYRFLEDAPSPAASAPAPPPEAAPAPTGAPPASSPSAASAPPTRDADALPWDADEPSARLELPGTPPGLGPAFYDLASVLAEPIPIYLGDVDLPDGQSAENLEMARLYIDLLDVLRQKTVGNLTAQESAFLEDLLYRLRVRYVQKRG